MAYQFNNWNEVLGIDPISDFMRAPITGDIQEIPGINSNEKYKLASGVDAVHTTFQLIGRVLLLKSFNPGTMQLINCELHCALVAQWLSYKGIDNGQSIALILIEKIGTLMPGLYDVDQLC
jgi:hypothetical protein